VTHVKLAIFCVCVKTVKCGTITAQRVRALNIPPLGHQQARYIALGRHISYFQLPRREYLLLDTVLCDREIHLSVHACCVTSCFYNECARCPTCSRLWRGETFAGCASVDDVNDDDYVVLVTDDLQSLSNDNILLERIDSASRICSLTNLQFEHAETYWLNENSLFIAAQNNVCLPTISCVSFCPCTTPQHSYRGEYLMFQYNY
jgi:hypothetical protein